MQDKLNESIETDNYGHVKTVVGSKARVGPRDNTKAQPEIDVRKEDGRVHSIVITCPCGEQVTVVCEYAS